MEALSALRSDDLAYEARLWGEPQDVSLYLSRCQVDTPSSIVWAAWEHVQALRSRVGKVLDLGAGDGRFAYYGTYDSYVGYEIDRARSARANLPSNARLIHRCAFSEDVNDADLAIGNPPFVRNQDLPVGWRQQAAAVVRRRLGVTVSGLANAWLYFFLQALASLKDDGLCLLIIPYEWVSRPSAQSVRSLIQREGWDVSVYRLVDETFDSVLTTSCITIVDKARRTRTWRYFEEHADGSYVELASPSGAEQGVISYARRRSVRLGKPRAMRGLSPGTQKVLVLTEGQRARSGLRVGRDVVPCVTTLRHFPRDVTILDEAAFRRHLRDAGHRCWLIRTDRPPSPALQAYLEAVPPAAYETSTCLKRPVWWAFTMPATPDLLMAQSFKGPFPRAIVNVIGAAAVGGVTGIHDCNADEAAAILGGLGGLDLRNRVVAHSNGLRKIEINQMNALLQDHFGTATTR